MKNSLSKYISKERLFRLWRRLCLHLPIDNRKVVMEHFGGMPFGCHPKAIALALHKLDPTIKIIWMANKGIPKSTPEWVREVSWLPWRCYHECTARVWVANNRKSWSISVKRPGQFYVQTWHGMLKGKKVENDVADRLGPVYLTNAKKDSAMADLFISNCRFITDLYHRAFWYDGKVLECGSPRMDALIKAPHGSGVVRRHFGIPQDQGIALWAPTFRKCHEDVYDLDIERTRRALERRFGRPFVMLVRMHPVLSSMHFGIRYDDRTYDATLYPDLYELLAESDVEINDYSGSMFEFGLLKRPVFLYATDIEKQAGDRGFYFPMETLPFPLARNNSELEQAILGFNEKDYLRKVDEWYADKGVHESGHASEDVARYILEYINRSSR